MEDFLAGGLPDDRRQALRLPTEMVRVNVVNDAAGSHPGVIVNISRIGVRFRTTFCFPCGSYVTLNPPLGTDLQPVHVRLVRQRVVGDREDGTTVFEYGSEIVPQTGARRHAWFLTLRKAA